MPEASVIKNEGNSDLDVKNVFGRYFRLENTGNGDSKIIGTIDALDINKTGNGDVNAENLIAKKATLHSTGNGNLTVNVSDTLSAKVSGNGNIINKGKAKFDANSKKIRQWQINNQPRVFNHKIKRIMKSPLTTSLLQTNTDK